MKAWWSVQGELDYRRVLNLPSGQQGLQKSSLTEQNCHYTHVLYKVELIGFNDVGVGGLTQTFFLQTFLL